MKKGNNDKQVKETQDPEIEQNVHVRILQYLNGAKKPQDLVVLPKNEQEVLIDPEHRRKRPFHYEPQLSPQKDPKHGAKNTTHPDELCSHKIADQILAFRQAKFPLGFTHVFDIRELLGDSWLDFIRGLLDWFRGRNYGSWSPPYELSDSDGHLSVVHAAVINTGEVLMIEHACHVGISKTPIWDPKTRTLVTAPTSPTEGLYCSGHCFLSDGKLLVVGGHGDSGHNPGQKDIAWLYNPSTNTWDVTRDKTSVVSPQTRTKMHKQRWYPTLVNVGDEPGRVLIASGDLDSLLSPGGPQDAMQMEVFNESSGSFDLITTPADMYHNATYPGLHILPNGEIFFAPVGFRSGGEPEAAYSGNEDSAYFDFTGTFTGEWTPGGGANDRTKGMSVLLLSQSYPFVQVMTVGGGDMSTTRTNRNINLSVLNPVWDAPLSNPTAPGAADPVSWIHPNLVLLPDGTLFVCGGTPAGDPCWLYNPKTHLWSQMDAMTHERRYHSLAVLCPTGEVMATGGKHSQAGEDTAEVFKPPYFFRGTQPVISKTSPTPGHHGGKLIITTTQASDIAEVVLMRPMAVTHQTDSEQRRIELCFVNTGTNTLEADLPNGRHPHAIAPRGWYMLFVLNSDGVPSKAEFIELH